MIRWDELGEETKDSKDCWKEKSKHVRQRKKYQEKERMNIIMNIIIHYEHNNQNEIRKERKHVCWKELTYRMNKGGRKIGRKLEKRKALDDNK